MPSAPADLEAAEELVAERPGPKEILRRSFISGLAVLLPLVVTLFVISFVVGFLANTLDPLVAVLQETPYFGPGSDGIILALSIFSFVCIVVLIGIVAEFGTESGKLSRQFDEFMESIPGVGSVYTSFNRMSELLLDSDTDSFQEVKLVEYPGADSYVVAFKTAETADAITDATGNDEMVTLFMPMAPNPVMGGFVIHVSTERVVDVDLTVEQGIRSIVTSGVAVGDTDVDGLSEAQMRELSHVQPAEPSGPTEDGFDAGPDRSEEKR